MSIGKGKGVGGRSEAQISQDWLFDGSDGGAMLGGRPALS